MDNQPRNRRIVGKFEELPPRKRPLTEIMPPQETDVDYLNYRMNREATDDSVQDKGVRRNRGEITLGANISSDQDSKISRIDDVDDQKNKGVAEDEVPVQKHSRMMRLFGVNVAADSSTSTAIHDGDDREKNAGQADDDDGEKRENVMSSERNSNNMNVVPPRIVEEIQVRGGTEPPFFLFKKKLGLSDVESSCNRLYFTSCSELMWALPVPEVEREKLDFLRVVTTDPNGVDYEIQLQRISFMGMHLLGHEWGKLVRANALQQGDRVQGWGYHVGDQLRMALIIIKS